jgi:glutathione S-transferase
MLTVYHAPDSRSEVIVQLIDAMGIRDQVQIVEVTIPRYDGSGGRDPRNPHPEGKVPYLVNGSDHVRERGAIITYLTDMFPESGLGRSVGDPQRGEYLSWLFYYQGVMEPVAILRFADISHPAIEASLRNYDASLERLDEVLTRQPYLLGDRFSAADMLCSGPFIYFGDQLPATTTIKDWAERCKAQCAATPARENA